MPSKAAIGKLLFQAAKSGDATTVEAAFQTAHASGSEPSPSYLARAILDCHPLAAPAMMKGLRELSSDPIFHEHLPALMIYGVRGTGRLIKLVTVLSEAGFDPGVGGSLLLEEEQILRHARRLANYKQSAHARMEARRVEPDPQTLIARPWWKPFYGTDVNRFPGDMAIWQRFITPVFDVQNPHSPANRGIFLVVLSLIFALFTAL